MLVEQLGRGPGIRRAHPGQVRAHVVEHGDHRGHDGRGIGAFQATIRAADDLGLDQLVGDLL